MSNPSHSRTYSVFGVTRLWNGLHSPDKIWFLSIIENSKFQHDFGKWNGHIDWFNVGPLIFLFAWLDSRQYKTILKYAFSWEDNILRYFYNLLPHENETYITKCYWMQWRKKNHVRLHTPHTQTQLTHKRHNKTTN